MAQWSQESSLPVSRTMVTLCGGDPTVNVTVNVTLCRNESLLLVGIEPLGVAWILSGKMRCCVGGGFGGERERERVFGVKKKKNMVEVIIWRSRLKLVIVLACFVILIMEEEK